MMKQATCVAVLAAMLYAAPLAAKPIPNKPGQYAPHDTCTANPGARDFVTRLRTAQDDMNIDALKAMAGREVVVTFGDEQGPDVLEQLFLLDQDQWRQLGETLKLGCKLEGDKLTLPWFFTLDFGNADMTRTLLATGRAVPVYATESAKAKVLGKLNWQLVELVGPNQPGKPMQKVRAVGSKLAGYVMSAQLRSQIDQRVVAVQEDGEWKISALVAGD